MSVISISNLNFGYKKNQVILKELNIDVPQGSIYGFLGRNGAGKSTTIRNILGLLRPQSGTINIFGKDIRSSRPKVFQQIGSLIESPSFYPQLNAIDNLKIACRYLGVSTKRIDSVLEQVNLSAHQKKASRKYSTGMKQRLGLAMALLHNPDLLILDEPISGLDPTGIIEIRNIITQLQATGKTILLSSHLLSEIEKIATHVGIINNGSMIFEGTLKELDDLKASNPTVKIKALDLEKAKSALSAYDIIEMDRDSLYLTIGHRKELPGLIKHLVDSGIDLYEVMPMKGDLEQLFIDMMTEDGPANSQKEI